MKTRKKIVMLVLVFSFLLSACSAARGEYTNEITEPPQTSNVESTEAQEVFWILTTETVRDKMNYQIQDAVKLLQKSHPDLKIEVEYLPSGQSEELDIRLQQLRTDILAGKGPDVYVLPSSSSQELPFLNVQQTICNGHFLDISSYYDADTELGKEALNSTIMDAGVWEGGRYVLPLRYDMGVYVVDTDRFEQQTGKDLEWLANTNVQAMMDEALAENNELLAKCAWPALIVDGTILAYFPNSIDYGSDSVLLTEDTLEKLWSGVNSIAALTDDQERFGTQDYQFDFTVTKYINQTSMDSEYFPHTYFAESELPVDQATISTAASIVMVNKATGVNDTILPVRSVDGSTTAWVTWYGAVGSSCDDPALAYEYLRCFLTEEFQWELNRPTIISWQEMPPESTGMIENGWPVRYEGMADYITGCYMRHYRHFESSPEFANLHGMLTEVKQIESIELTREDLSFLDFQIDNVYFPTSLERQFYGGYYTSNLDLDTLGCPELMEPAEMAKDTLKRLTVQIAEG